MLSLKTGQFTSVPILSLLVGGYLLLTSQYNPAQAQIPKNDFSVAQLPSLSGVPINQEPLQQAQLMQPVEFSQDQYNVYSQPAPITQISQNSGKYIVYVNSSNSQILQRVRQVEKTAYIRQLNGQKIIQAGTFTRLLNAQQRVRELASQGINGASVANDSNTQGILYNPVATYNPVPTYNPSGEIATYYPANNPNPVNYNNVQQQKSKFYYAIIPSTYEKLGYLGGEVQQRIGRNITVLMRTEPRGAHVAVGPFAERSVAEQWNNYLKNLGYGSTRLYYGK